ncbi:Amidohydrolase 3, partial [Metarhizium majus ARSEF 297]
MASHPSTAGLENATAYINGRVFTVDENQTWAEAFIVSAEGVFALVGSTDTVMAAARQHGMVVHDLHGRFVMPGIHDAHVHLLTAGLSHFSNIHLGLDEIMPMSEATDKLKSSSCGCEYAHAFGRWLSADVFRIKDFDRAHLDEEYPDTPVIIRAGAGHSLHLNTAALRESGYDLANESYPNGAYVGRRPDGSLNGEVAELATTKALLACPKPPVAHVRRALKYAVHRLHQAGVTSCQEAATNTLMLSTLRDMDRDGQLQLDAYTHIVYAPEFIAEESQPELIQLLDRAESFKTQHVDTRFVKIILDGVPLDPYFTQAGLDKDGNVEQEKLFLYDLQEAVLRYDQRGMTCKIHCTGEGATRLALDAIEAARARNPNGPRHEIAHCSGVHPDEYPRFRPLNTTAEMSPSVFFCQTFSPEEDVLQDWNFPQMLRHGAHISIGSDWGVPESPDLLPGVEGILDAVGSGDRAKGAAMVLRMLTLAGAEAVGRDKETGSIQAGKRANFIELDRDLSLGEPGAFTDAKVRRTWFEGELVYTASV